MELPKVQFRRTNTPQPTHPLQTASLATFRGDALTDLLAGLAANSIGSFVKGFTPLRASVAGLFTTDILAKPGMTNSPDSFSSLLVHACGHEVTGLKTYRGPKRKEQLGVCSLPGFYVPEVVGREFCLGAPDCSVVINSTLAIERRGGRGGEE